MPYEELLLSFVSLGKTFLPRLIINETDDLNVMCKLRFYVSRISVRYFSCLMFGVKVEIRSKLSTGFRLAKLFIFGDEFLSHFHLNIYFDRLY